MEFLADRVTPESMTALPSNFSAGNFTAAFPAEITSVTFRRLNRRNYTGVFNIPMHILPASDHSGLVRVYGQSSAVLGVAQIIPEGEIKVDRTELLMLGALVVPFIQEVLGREPTPIELHSHTHKRQEDQQWVDESARRAYEQYIQLRESQAAVGEGSSAGSTDYFDYRTWSQAVGGMQHGRVYGLGS
ncbi:hypothetical protein IEQ34_007346 [Dendrobium chrysotoxum]|uniref:Uncharacterized protein n=1 Tax=Dendrobium chrysotoxum TaxID=161865 RepID=A0AAV7H914_DENCH|nr:hypothetical protein IEQ34_007346 [Dendrobium chrysotoxum]